MLKQLTLYLSENDLLEAFQLAFRASYSTETALVKVTNDLLLQMDENSSALLLLLDLSAAFDTIDHAVLINRLKDVFGISSTALAWLESYLCDRSHFVLINPSPRHQ